MAAAPAVTSADNGAAESAAPSVSQTVTVPSPMVGTFYRSPSPTAEPFVSEGDTVAVDQVLCVLEAMKLFNELKSEHAGVIRAVLVGNAEPVEYGQPLFELESELSTMLRRVLIANRGEAAVRLVRACHDLGAEAVAVYSTADSDGLWVGMADRAVCIGPHAPADSYLRVPNLIAAAETTGCDAVHPGWGFLAENAGFVRACEDNDLVFVGPSAEAIELMGDKSRAKQTMSRRRRAAGAGQPGAAVGRRRGGPARRPGRLPGAAEGVRRWRRPRHADGRRAGSGRGGLPDGVGRGRERLRGRRHVPREGDRRAADTSRCRCWPTATAACWCWASATARCSAGTRS